MLNELYHTFLQEDAEHKSIFGGNSDLQVWVVCLEPHFLVYPKEVVAATASLTLR